MTRARIVMCVLLVSACRGGGGASQGAAEPQQVNTTPSDPCFASLDPQATRDLMASSEVPSSHEPGMQALERFTDEMCACSPGDTVCAEGVSDEMKVWAQDYARSHADADRPMTPAESERAETLAGRMGECLHRVVLPPSTDPATTPHAKRVMTSPAP